MNESSQEKVGPEHAVRFYQSEAFLSEAVCQFIVEGLAESEHAIIVATPAHRRAFAKQLGAKKSSVTMFDAEETLARFMVDDMPSWERFLAVIGPVIEEIAGPERRKVRAYGEMVDLLWQQGKRDAAIRLEEMWNDLRRHHEFSLLCAYAIDTLYKEHSIAEICRTHSHVLPHENVAAESTRVLTTLQKLNQEILHRAQVETALRGSLAETRRAKDDLEEFLENAVLGIHRVDRNGIIRWANPAELELLGYTREEYVGQPIANFHVDADVIDDILARLLRGETLHDYEARLRAKDGSIKHVAISSNVQRKNGEFMTTRCFTRDVTALKQAELDRDAIWETGKLLTAELDLQKLVQTLTDHATRLSKAEFGAFFYNLIDDKGESYMLYTLSGVPRDKFSKFPMPRNTAVFGPTFKGEGIIRLDDVTQDPRYGKNAPHHGMPEGHLPVRSYLAVSVKSANGEVLGGLFFGHSQPGVFTAREENVVAAIATQAATAIGNARLYEAEHRARKAAELAERRTALLHKIAVELSRSITAEDACKVVINESRRLIDASAGAVMLLDATRTHTDRMIVDGDHDPAVVAKIGTVPLDAPTPLAEAARTGEVIWLCGRDAILARYPHLQTMVDEVGAVTWGVIPMQFEGMTIGSIGFRMTQERELTTDEESILLAVGRQCAQAVERARLHDANLTARAEAEAASRAKDEFLAMLGHELRNPLSPILTAAQLMKMRGDRASMREQSIIERQVNHLIHLVDDLLDISRITRGKIDLDKRPHKLASLVTKALEITGPLCEEHRHRVAVDLADEDILVVGDETRLTQVLTNLLSNAAKFTRVGGKIEVRVVRAGSRVRIHVKDDGMGIAPDLLPRIFELFVQGPRSTDRSRGGLGIGLALVRQLVTMHDGTVTADSAGLDMGSEFIVELPTVEQRTDAAKPAMRHRMTVTPRRILVVDDNEDAGSLMGEMLRSIGHDVCIAQDGPRALEALNHFTPEVAILDIGLPVMDGYELAAALFARFGSDLRLMAVTGYGQEQDKIRTQRAGFEAHFVKPVGLGKVLAAIEAPPKR
jgi:PAS domain S-box-containing protein